MSATSPLDDTKSRLTIRLTARELELIRELARQRRTDMAAIGREAINAYLEGADPRAETDRLLQALRETLREQETRILTQHQQDIRRLIEALNDHLAPKP